MANTAPMTHYQGQGRMKKYEGSRVDKMRDKSSGKSERSPKERAEDTEEAAGTFDKRAKKTILGAHKKKRV